MSEIIYGPRAFWPVFTASDFAATAADFEEHAADALAVVAADRAPVIDIRTRQVMA